MRARLALCGTLLLLDGCYNPELGGPGGFVCATSPSCPAGFDCVSGRCVPAGQRPPDARLEPRPDGPTPRPEARVDARVDGPAADRVASDRAVDAPLPLEGPPPLPDQAPPPPLTCTLTAPGQALSPSVHALGEHFDFEAANGEEAVAFFSQPTPADKLLPRLVRRTSSSLAWPAANPVYLNPAANPPVGAIDPGHEIAVALPIPSCADPRAVVVFRHAGGVWYATDGASPASWGADGHSPSGLGLDLIPATGWSGTKPPQPAGCAVFWATYGVDPIGTRRIPIDVSLGMVHWFHSVDGQLAQHVAQSWDGNLHYVTFSTLKEVWLRMGGGDFVDADTDGTNDPWPADPTNQPVLIETISAVPVQDHALETAEGRTVFTGFDPLQKKPVVRLVEPAGAGTLVTAVAPGTRPSLAVVPAMQEAVAFITPGGAQLVARNFGGVWSLPVQIPGATRIKVRAVSPATFDVVYRRATPLELVAERYVCK